PGAPVGWFRRAGSGKPARATPRDRSRDKPKQRSRGAPRRGSARSSQGTAQAPGDPRIPLRRRRATAERPRRSAPPQLLSREAPSDPAQDGAKRPSAPLLAGAASLLLHCASELLLQSGAQHVHLGAMSGPGGGIQGPGIAVERPAGGAAQLRVPLVEALQRRGSPARRIRAARAGGGGPRPRGVLRRGPRRPAPGGEGRAPA